MTYLEVDTALRALNPRGLWSFGVETTYRRTGERETMWSFYMGGGQGEDPIVLDEIPSAEALIAAVRAVIVAQDGTTAVGSVGEVN